MTAERAVQELFECAGTQFDRAVADAFASVLVEDGQLTGRDKNHRRQLAGSGVGSPQE